MELEFAFYLKSKSLYFECQNHRKEYSKNAKLIQEWWWSRRKWCRRRHCCRYAPQSDWIQNNEIYILGAIANEKVDHTHSNAFNSVDRKVNKKNEVEKRSSKKRKNIHWQSLEAMRVHTFYCHLSMVKRRHSSVQCGCAF